MRILVISDTHGNFPLAVHACDLAEPFDLLFHLGDGWEDAELLKKTGIETCINVSGNCDIGSTAPRELIWEGEGKKILLTHGDTYGVKSGLGRLIIRAKECGVDVVLFGHTHRSTSQIIDGILFVNPGALTKTAQHHSCAILEVKSSGEISSTHYDVPT